MDFESVKKVSGFPQRGRKWIILLAVFGVSGYGVYKVYHLPSVTRKRKRLMKLLGAIVSVAVMVSDSAETICLVSRDLKEFLQSDSDEISNSLKQISKLARSKEFTASLARVSEALTIGIFRGYNSDLGNGNESGTKSPDSCFADKIMDRIFSTSGSGFVSVVAGSFARHLVLAFYSDDQKISTQCGMSSPERINLLCDDKFKELLADCVEKFVSTAVSVYLEKARNINSYDEIFAGLTNPKHRDSMRDILVSVCNGALETLVRTSHGVLTSSKPSKGSAYRIIDKNEENNLMNDNHFRVNGWAGAISSTLSVPSNRKFVFDVAGRVTMETTRSIVEFMLWKILEGFKTSFYVVRGEVVDRGRRVIEYTGAKSSVIVTVLLALYLQVSSGTRVLMPA